MIAHCICTAYKPEAYTTKPTRRVGSVRVNEHFVPTGRVNVFSLAVVTSMESHTVLTLSVEKS